MHCSLLEACVSERSKQSSDRGPDLCRSHHGWESSVLSVAEALAHVGQVGHAASVGSVQGAVVLLDAFGHFLLAVLDLGQLATSLHAQRHRHTQTVQ